MIYLVADINKMQNTKTIGIVGGGQLGRMLAQAGQKMGYKVIVLDPTPGSPAGLVADSQIVGSFKEREKILELAGACDYMTFEIESADALTLEELAANGMSVHPSPQTLALIKDKFRQKVFLREHDIPVADFAIIESQEDCVRQGEIFGYPYLLKTRFDAYDGRGNFVIPDQDAIPFAFEKFAGQALYAEKFVPFTRELAVVAVRDVFGTIVTYPVVETIHRNNICHIVRSPAAVTEDIKIKAESLAKKVLDALAGVGTMAIEMFLTADGDVLVNEIAPRVHNSGHHTIEAFDVSQFENHMRAVSGMAVSEPRPLAAAAVMINILGERVGPALLSGADEADALGGVSVHVYGKLETRPERKMGHITVLGENLEEAEEKAMKARNIISI